MAKHSEAAWDKSNARRILHSNRKARRGLGKLHWFREEVPAVAAPRALSRKIHEEPRTDGVVVVVRVMVPAEMARANIRQLGAYLTSWGTVRVPGMRCFHEHDCCGCVLAYPADVLERHGRTLVISQYLTRNY